MRLFIITTENMDIDLLAKMVEELILDNDEVSLPGVGTFVAELIPATFSDKGFTINPPYRKLSFRQREGDGNLLVNFYAKANDLKTEEARRILTTFLNEMKDVLKAKKFIIFPGLGKLRATKENFFFFVPDENLNIYPEGFGLESVSLKSHKEVDDAALAAEVLAAEVSRAAEVPEAPKAAETSEAAPVAEAAAPEAAAPAPAVAEPAAVETPSPEPVVEQPAAPAVPAEEPVEVVSGTPCEEVAEICDRRRGLPGWARFLITIIVLAVIFFAALAILGRVAPEVVDRLLYSQEELQILYR